MYNKRLLFVYVLCTCINIYNVNPCCFSICNTCRVVKPSATEDSGAERTFVNPPLKDTSAKSKKNNTVPDPLINKKIPLKDPDEVEKTEEEKYNDVIKTIYKFVIEKNTTIIASEDEFKLIYKKIHQNIIGYSKNKKLNFQLLYKATRDGDMPADFHNKCDDAKRSIVLVKTTKNRRFGGFTTCSWEGGKGNVDDEKAFVFSLDKKTTYDNIPGNPAIGCDPNFGPIFSGCQIRFLGKNLLNIGSTVEAGCCYNTTEDYVLNGGEEQFVVEEIEVFEVNKE